MVASVSRSTICHLQKGGEEVEGRFEIVRIQLDFEGRRSVLQRPSNMLSDGNELSWKDSVGLFCGALQDSNNASIASPFFVLFIWRRSGERVEYVCTFSSNRQRKKTQRGCASLKFTAVLLQ
jgi:hypothetical protein